MKNISFLFLYSLSIYASDKKEEFVNIKLGEYKYKYVPLSLFNSSDTMLSKMFNYNNNKNKKGYYKIYRSRGDLFKYILEFFETKQIKHLKEDILKLIIEADYFCFKDLIVYLRPKIGKEMPIFIWLLIPYDEIIIIKSTEENSKDKDSIFSYYIFNKTMDKIINRHPYGSKNLAREDLDLRRGHILPLWNGACSLPYNLITEKFIGSVKERDTKFDPAPLMDHIYNSYMCSRYNKGYAIYNILTGDRISDLYWEKLDDCIEQLTNIAF